VFAGDKPRAYGETDRVGPINVYGASKEGGEQAVRSANPRHVIIRTAWVMSPFRANFLLTMLRLSRERERLEVVADQWGSPTSARHLAGALAEIAMRLAQDPEAPIGTFHLANVGPASRYELAVEIMRRAYPGGTGAPEVVPVAAAALPPPPARRPPSTVLNCRKIAREYGLKLPSWRRAVAEIIGELKPPQAEGAARARERKAT
jgi:dTDP-4-dehydrorhamnose reductase